MRLYRVLRAFIASPSDVRVERGMAEEVIDKVNVSIRDTLGSRIEVRRWEQLAPVTPSTPEATLQDRIMDEVNVCDFFILILYKRYGTREAGHAKSNTEREIDAILERRKRQPQIKVFSYFRDLALNDDQGEQESEVRKLRERLAHLGIPYSRYKSEDEFRDQLTHDLYDQVLRMRTASFKTAALRNVWRFGGEEAPRHDPRLAIVYPPAERAWFADGQESDYWIRRLTTEIAFEDHKAIEKIMKTLGVIGFSSYHVYPSPSLPPVTEGMNWLWLCLPRNQPGLKRLTSHRNARFAFPRPGRSRSRRPNSIQWKSKSGETITIKSPLEKYLSEQRSEMRVSGEWHRELGHVVAKDFAVLARLDRENEYQQSDIRAKDFFLSGIRGLGTWGAAWVLDQGYRRFRRADPDVDIQLLLEVTFWDGRIVSVEDVSEEPAAYFRDQCKVGTVRSVMREVQDYWP